jgi:putative MFS transporter
MDDLAIAARIDRLPISAWHRWLLLILSIPLFFDVSDIFTFAYAAPVLRHLWGLTINQVALITSSCFLGMALGGTVGGVIADRIGRVKAMMLFTATFSVFSLANGFATNVPMLLATRFATGLGIASATVTVITYIAEIYPAAVRGRWQSWAMVIALSGISITSFVARGVIPQGDNGWRFVFIWGALGLPFLYFARRLPESPRWLAHRGRQREAEASLVAKTRRATRARLAWALQRSLSAAHVVALRYLVFPDHRLLRLHVLGSHLAGAAWVRLGAEPEFRYVDQCRRAAWGLVRGVSGGQGGA